MRIMVFLYCSVGFNILLGMVLIILSINYVRTKDGLQMAKTQYKYAFNKNVKIQKILNSYKIYTNDGRSISAPEIESEFCK